MRLGLLNYNFNCYTRHFLSHPTRQIENLPFLILLCLLNDYIFSTTCTILHSFCSSFLGFSIPLIPCLFTSSAPHIAQLFLGPLPLIILGFRPLVVIPPIFYKCHYLPPHCLPLHAHDCSSRQQSFCPTMLLYLFPYFS